MITMLVLTGGAMSKDKPLKVFILAGQSNMVGHSRGHTIATLFNSEGPKDKELTQLVFKKDSKVSKAILDEQLVRARKGDELKKGIEAMTDADADADADAKAAAEAEVEKIKAAGEAYKKVITDSLIVSDRVYINSISDGNKKSGKLSIGHAVSDDNYN